jgi:hypothetical protein
MARIYPIGDMDVVIGQECRYRAAQQRREIAGEWGDNQHSRIVRTVCGAAEAQHVAPNATVDHLLDDRNLIAVNDGAGVAERRLAEILRVVLEVVERRRGPMAEWRVAQRISRHFPQAQSAAGDHAHGLQAGALPFIVLV